MEVVRVDPQGRGVQRQQLVCLHGNRALGTLQDPFRQQERLVHHFDPMGLKHLWRQDQVRNSRLVLKGDETEALGRTRVAAG